MTLVSMQHIPLASSYLCEDCHCVGNCAEQCPACASEALMGLARILNRGYSEEATESAFHGKVMMLSHWELDRRMTINEFEFPAA